jgi:hypothetical protein
MSNDELRQAGHYALKSFFIIRSDGYRVDISKIIHKFNIVESMSAGCVRGSAVVYDANDLITRFGEFGENIGIKAEEFVEITYSDYYDNERIETYFLYSITDVGYATDAENMIKYTLNFVSLGKFISENFRVAKAYRPNNGTGLISDYVKEIFEEFYVNPLAIAKLPIRDIEVEPTVGPQSYVIPRMTPEQAMHFFSRKAFSSNNKSQSFRFFENRNKYYFATNEYMIDYVSKGGVSSSIGVDPSIAMAIGMRAPTIPIFRRNYATDKTADGQELAMSRFINIDFGVKTDTIDDINSGAYYRSSYEIDVINGTLTKFDYNHFDYSEVGVSFPHEKDFVDQRINKPKERFIVKDYASPGNPGGTNVPPDRNYSTLHNVKTSYFYHYNKNKVSATIYGRNTLFAGLAIDVELTKQVVGSDTTDKRDDERSGRYIIESIENSFDENIFTQKLVLSRSGIGA